MKALAGVLCEAVAVVALQQEERLCQESYGKTSAKLAHRRDCLGRCAEGGQVQTLFPTTFRSATSLSPLKA